MRNPVCKDCATNEAYKQLQAENKEMKEALERIRSGLGKDSLGVTSLSREDMQSIAEQALKGEEDGKTNIFGRQKQ